MKLEEYVAQLASEDEVDRIYAAEDLGGLGDPRGVLPLVSRLTDEPSRVVQEAIFQALARIDDDSVVRCGISLLSHDEASIRNQAIGLLQGRGESALPELRRLLTSPDHDLRKFAIDAISQIGASSAQSLLGQALDDSDLNVVIAALENIRTVCDPSLREAVLDKALNGSHPMLVLAAMEALTRVGDESTYRKLRERHLKLAEASSLYLRPLLQLLGTYGDLKDLPEVGDFLLVCDPAMRGTCLDALRNLIIRLGVQRCDSSTWQKIASFLSGSIVEGERYHSILLLGVFGANELVREILIPYLHSSGKGERLAAVDALGQWPEAEQVLREQLLIEQGKEVQQAPQSSSKPWEQ